VGEGDEVLTHEGTYQRVSWTTTHAYHGELVEVQPTGFPPFRLTPNHPVWAFPRAGRLKAGRPKRPHVQAALDAGDVPRWIPAGDLQPGWIVAYPVLQEKEDRATLTAEGLGIIPVDDDFLTLSGYYLAEGTLSGKGGKPYQQFFYFHERERDYVDRLCAILTSLGVRPSVRRRRHCAEVVTHSLALGQLLERLYGRGAEAKRLPVWMLTLPHGKQRALLRALWEGDGYTGCDRATYCSSSYVLALQAQQIALRLGIAAFLHHRDQRDRRRNWVVSVTSKSSLAKLGDVLGRSVGASGSSGHSGQVVLDDRTLYVGIRAIRRAHYAGPVHNLEVDGAHSFVVPGAALHNCEVNGPGEARAADIGVAGGRGIGLIFKNGEVIRKVPEKDIVSAMREEVDKFVAERKAARATAGTRD
jgi:intein/homing endonuclease